MLSIVVSVQAKRFTLVIDAGHGGKDAGAVGQFSKEKDINLRTALAFGKYVENHCPDVNVVYTRKKDVFVTLMGRADIANKAKADLFISIHTNSLPSRHVARGMETYTLGMHRAADNFDVAKRENSVILVEEGYKERYQDFDPNSAESYIIFELMQDNNMHKSVEMAKLIQSNTCRMASRPNKGVKQAGFLVLRETSMPSCLIELGFISTPDEERLLNDESRIDDIARGIYQAFVSYKEKYDPTGQPPLALAEKPKEEKTVVEPTVVKEEKQKTRVLEDKETNKEPEKERKNNEMDEADSSKPVFKVQVFVAERVLKANDAKLKGEKEADYYKEGNAVKYTIGASNDYNEINELRKKLNSKFNGCFVVAFKDGAKMNLNEAIREYRNNR